LIRLEEHHKRNARSLAAFGVRDNQVAQSSGVSRIRSARSSSAVTLFTIGYEGRDGQQVMDLLKSNGVSVLSDVRQRPMSRKPDFRRKALQSWCVSSGIEYQSWTSLGSNDTLRDRLRETGDFAEFTAGFHRLAQASMVEPLDDLAKVVLARPTALLCFEREHCDCHRSIVASLIAQRIETSIVPL
jgi:uncharacterized protein (DUF488 family)